MSLDVHQMRQLAAALASDAHHVDDRVAPVVARGALNVKNGWRDNARVTAGRHARLYPASISYDMHRAPGASWAEIGPDKNRPQGALGNLLEFGSVHNPPHNDGGRALADEEPAFRAHIAAVVDPLGLL